MASHLIVAIAFFTTIKVFFTEQLNGVPKYKKNTENFGYQFYNKCNVLHPELQGSPVRDFFLFGLKWINLLLVRPFEVRRHMPLIGMLSLEAQVFALRLYQENAPSIWAIPSVEYKDREEGHFLCLLLLTLQTPPFIHWHESQLFQDSNIHRRPAETPSLLGRRNYQILGLFVASHC